MGGVDACRRATITINVRLEDFPDHVNDVADPDVLQDVGGLHDAGHTGENLIIVSRVSRPTGRSGGVPNSKGWQMWCPELPIPE
jgi:hypothetical protein